MAKKLFVGGLAYQTTEDTIRASFSQFGTVESVKIITDRETGQPRGFAFVEMATPEGAEKVIDILNGSELDGRRLTIKEAVPMQSKPRM